MQRASAARLAVGMTLLLPATVVVARSVAHGVADVYAETVPDSSTGVYATYSPRHDVAGTLAEAQPFDGCAELAPRGPLVLVATLLPNSSCTPMEQALNAQRAGAAAIINVAVGAGAGYIWLMQPTARDDALRLSRPRIPHLSVSSASGAALVAAARRLEAGKIVSRTAAAPDAEHKGIGSPSYIFACVAMVLAVVVVPMALLRLLCRQNRVQEVAPAGQHGPLGGAGQEVVRAAMRRFMPVTDCEDADETCAVCIEPLGGGGPVRTLVCSHRFHAACVDPWLLQHRTCPLCKDDILRPRALFG